MGKDQSKEKERAAEALFIKGLPIIHSKYKVKRFLGGGAFGKVYLVEDEKYKGKKKDKKEFALKVIPLSFKKKMSPEQKKDVLKKAKLERQMLEILSGHESIVELMDTWVDEYSPFFGGRKAQCILLEFCRGSDMDLVLKACEEGKIHFPRYMAIYWFIKIMESAAYIHEKSILHRDIKPDNILVVYDSLEKDLTSEGYRNIGLKLSDFGSSVNIKRKKARDIAGQIYFTAPEVWAMELKDGYDSRCDVWSLGVMLAQMYKKVSLDVFQNNIHDVFKRIEKEPKLNKIFRKKYRVKKGTPVLYLKFMAETGLFMKMAKKMVPDKALRVVLSNMIVKYEKRLFVKDLLELPQFKIWKYAMFRSTKLSDIKKEECDVDSLVTLLTSELDDERVFIRIIDIIEIFISLELMDFTPLIEKDCFPVLFSAFSEPWTGGNKKSRSRYFLKVIKLFVGEMIKLGSDKQKVSECVRPIVVEWRKHKGLSELLQHFIIMSRGKADGKYINYFAFLLTIHWCPLAKTFDVQLFDHLKNRVTEKNKKMMFFMLEQLATRMPLENLLSAFPRIGERKTVEVLAGAKKKVKGLFGGISGGNLSQQFRDMSDMIPIDESTEEEEEEDDDNEEEGEKVVIQKKENEEEEDGEEEKKKKKEEEEEEEEEEEDIEVLFKAEEEEEEEEEENDDDTPKEIQKVGVFFLRFCPMLHTEPELKENAISNIINHIKLRDENLERILLLLLYIIEPLDFPKPKNEISLLFSNLSSLTKAKFDAEKRVENAKSNIKIDSKKPSTDPAKKAVKKKKKEIREELQKEIDLQVGFQAMCDKQFGNMMMKVTCPFPKVEISTYTNELGKVDTNPVLLSGEDLFCVAFYELMIGEGGINDGLKFGWSDKNTQYLLNTSTGLVEVQVEKSDDDEEEEEEENEGEEEETPKKKKKKKKKPKKKKKKVDGGGGNEVPDILREKEWTVKEKISITDDKTQRFYGFDGAFIGTGLTNKGHVFWTYNNKMFKMLDFPMDKSERKDIFYGVIKVKNNPGLIFKTNFGKEQFFFNFKNLEEQRQQSMNVAKTLNEKRAASQKDKNEKLIKVLEKYDPDLKHIKLACKSKMTEKIGKKILLKLGLSKEKVELDREDIAKKLFNKTDGLKAWDETEKTMFKAKMKKKE